MIIAIDGPAGAGKSTTAKLLAQRLGYAYIDTGAMYRALALAVLRELHGDLEDEAAIERLARDRQIGQSEDGCRTLMGESDVSSLIRSPEISDLASRISALPAVRALMVEQQRRIARRGEAATGGAVLEGRDIQTVVFPAAQVKVYLDANSRTRALRRQGDHRERGQSISFEAALGSMEARDRRDSSRAAAPLRAAPDAIHIKTDGIGPDAVVDKIVAIVRKHTPEP